MKKCCCFDKQSHDRLKRVIDFLKVIAEENRIKILCMLLNEGELCVCKIWTYLEAPQNLTSHHLKVMKDFGLLKARKEGLNIFYSVNQSEIQKYKELLNCLLLNDKEE